jgi:hypothetical protein
LGERMQAEGIAAGQRLGEASVAAE